MQQLHKLYELAATLNNTASNEGCEKGLTVVGDAELWDLLQCIRLLKASNEGQQSAAPVNDQSAEVQRLTEALAATQTALSQAMQQAEKAGQFVERVAGFSIWSYDKNDGSPYEECEEPSEGFLDSHCALMATIEDARDLLAAK